MKKNSIPVIIVSVLFVVVGCAGFVYHVKELYDPNYNLYQTTWVLFLEIVALVCGLLLFFRISWARWLAIAWLAYHVIISAFNSTSQMIAHIVFLIIVSILLFLPVSAAYFRSKKQQ